MPEPILCKICAKRRSRRFCLAVSGHICTICCGTEREVSLSCPLECEYLREAHRREKPVPVEAGHLSHPDIVVTEALIRAQEELMLFCVYSLVQAALRESGAVDSDVMAALDALIQTHRTLDSGLVYQTRSENSLAQAIQTSFTASLEDYQKLRLERESLTPVHNSEILAVLVFLHRIGQQNRNGRPRGRMFIDLLHQMTPQESVPQPAAGIIL